MKKSVLFVDDETNILDGLRRMLITMKSEWDMTFVNSGSAALEFLSKKHVDIIVTDMRMPEMDGVELLTQVQSKFPGVIRIILSGHSDKTMIMKSVKLAHQFLTKPCPAEKIKDTINSAYSMLKILKNEDVKSMVSRIDSLPSLPDTYLKVVDEMNSEDCSVAKVGALISSDVGMSANVLKLVNSSFFGFSNHISSPMQAVSLLGLDVVKGVLLTSHLFHSFKDENTRNFSLEKMMSHSILVARIAKAIALHCKMDRKTVDDCFIAGILHDIGKLIMLANFKVTYNVIIDNSKQENKSLWVSEKDILGVTHSEIGAYLLGLWGMPNSIVEAVALHHTPNLSINGDISPLTAVHLANVFEHRHVVLHENYEEHTLDMEYINRIGLTESIAELEALGKNICDETIS
ncbi:response regulator [Seleniivibrio woodruffii]|uniref:response regulator n=1 Tax=Seleniivibrio woodruffii TaxID=1078050 RepID=UPI0026EB6B50|nr:response regulator [Seleniivibrio woodruffii]